MTDALSGLSHLKFRNFCVPCSSMASGFEHSQARHLYYKRNGQNLEPTGRSGWEFSFKIPFKNGIQPAAGERWSITPLYPHALRKFVDLCMDPSVGDFVHPELGPYRCGVARIHWETVALVRGGCEMDVTWSEDNSDDDGDHNVAFDNVATIETSAADLDRAHATLEALRNQGINVPKLPTATFTTLARNIRNATDRVGQLSKDGFGSIDRLVQNARAVEKAVVGTPSAIAWPARESAISTEHALIDARADLVRNRRTIRTHIVLRRMTLASVARVLSRPVAEILELNPQYVQVAAISPQSVIRYYS